MPQKTIPVAMPAQREMANQFQVLNSGLASLPPKRMSPYLEKQKKRQMKRKRFPEI